MITLYPLDPSQSERIIWLTEELGLDYQVELFLRPRICTPGGVVQRIAQRPAFRKAIAAVS